MSDWNRFLITQGATQQANGTVDFSTLTSSTQQACLISLQQGIIEINGPDAVKFLQGQVTCDVRELANNTSLLGAQCNIKGRMLMCFRAVQPTPERILLRVHNGLVDSSLTSLGKYIVFSKAKLTDVSQNFCCMGLIGENAAGIIKSVFNLELAINNQWKAVGDSHIIRIDEHRYECWITSNTSETIWHQLREHAIPTSQNFWTLNSIAAGMGDITPETYEKFTPQAINFQLVNGINFRKGCYTGQEIVARLHYRGTLKRHMYRFEFDTENQPLPIAGSSLVNEDGKDVGEVVLAAYKTETCGELLASVVDDERIAIYIPQSTEKLRLLPLPYAIPTPNDAD